MDGQILLGWKKFEQTMSKLSPRQNFHKLHADFTAYSEGPLTLQCSGLNNLPVI